MLALSGSLVLLSVLLILIQKLIFPRFVFELICLAGISGATCGLPLFWLLRRDNFFKWFAVVGGTIVGFSIWLIGDLIPVKSFDPYLTDKQSDLAWELKIAGYWLGLYFGSWLVIIGVVFLEILHWYLRYWWPFRKNKDETE